MKWLTGYGRRIICLRFLMRNIAVLESTNKEQQDILQAQDEYIEALKALNEGKDAQIALLNKQLEETKALGRQMARRLDQLEELAETSED